MEKFNSRELCSEQLCQYILLLLIASSGETCGENIWKLCFHNYSEVYRLFLSYSIFEMYKIPKW